MLYVNTPSIALSQPDETHIAIAELDVEFADGRRAKYKARTVEILAGAGIWYYVTIEDRRCLGDRHGVELQAFAEPSHDKCGVDGFTYVGAIFIRRDPSSGFERSLPGGWPAPCRAQIWEG